MSSSSLHTCNKTQQAVGEIDCSTCQLAQMCHTKKSTKTAMPEEDDYSISTELTQKGNDYSIFYLVIAAIGVLAVVVLTYKFFII